jgi:hypothetical protein
VGARFASPRHIVLTARDVIRLDRSIVDRVSTDLVSPRWCAPWWVHDGQGWHFGRPGPLGDLTERAQPRTTGTGS